MTTRSRTAGTGSARRPVRVLVATAACTFALALTGCSGSGTGVRVEGPSSIPEAQAELDAGVDAEIVDVKPTPTVLKALDSARVDIADGQTVGAGTPITVTFDRPVPTAERTEVERQLKVVMDSGAGGSWSWVEDRGLADGQRVDFRPRVSWKPGTNVTVQVGAGLTRHFTVGRS
ncbi:Ig-like domain-containing protein [Streptomyces sp. DSM 40750]|uniref:Ig-like domain-containing protein n=1 Tax=Streptomyces sp. DSM 40750 TaxID=2801030 RepID=UPI00214CE3AE|nr:Ig-like domain-containing protein [Streptomyces sp. DSM 40750]UUU23588.1 Ig-like domain-containing protein [Streptomyces sp. DSM 40750]